MSKKITEESSYPNRLNQAEELTKTCLKEIITDFNEFIEKSKSIPTQIHHK